jgi:translation initiation factor IF-2
MSKIRIFSLAKELGMDSKVLIEHCRAVGLSVKGSALASISPEEKQIVMNQIAAIGGSATKAPEPQADLMPTREDAREAAGRMRNLSGIGRPAVTEEVEPEVEEEEVSTEAVAEEVTAPVVSESTPSETAEPAEVGSEPASTDVGSGDDGNSPAEESVDSIKRDDYVAAHGKKREVREMKPQPRSMTAVDRATRRGRQATPTLAAPPKFETQQPKQKVETERAQKPVISLTPEQILGQKSPLQQHLERSTRDKAATGGRRKATQFTDGGDRDTRAGSAQLTRDQRRKNRSRRGSMEDDGDRRRGRGRRQKRGPSQVELKSSGTLELPITVRTLSEAIGRPAKQIMGALFGRGTMVRINDSLDEELAWEIAAELGVELEIKRDQTSDEMLEAILDLEEPEELLQERPPVVTILGHVDHGKTSLLDKIRATNVVDGEAGGITQHIRSYQVDHGGRKITFVDTPGHAAFGEMRARGANVTDIIVLVVAANDSVMPQTVECIAHAKASGAPIIVAMNKMDLPNNNIDRVLTDLSTNGVQPQEWGGEIEVVRTSAETGDGLDDLLETILLTAEISELKANPECNAVGLCLEAFQDEGVGPIAWLIIEKGTLRVGDNVVCGGAHGRIRAIYDDLGQTIKEAPPSMPVKVAGLNQVPGAGDHFFVMDDIETARSIAEDHLEAGRTQQLSGRGQPRTLVDILDAAREGAVQDLNLILKADTPGSIEAIKGELDKIDHPEVRVKVLHDAVGGVNESDIYLASASDAVIIAFHVIADDRALQVAESEGVDIRRYDIIYEVTDHIKHTLEGLLEPEKVQVQTGRAVVLQTFSISRTGTIAGCRVLGGSIERNNRVHVIRDQTILNDYSIASLKRVKDDAKEVREGMECGIRLDGFNDVKEGDLLEAFRVDEIKRTLEG